MKIAIIGATGNVGKEAVAEALSRNLAVDAYNRSGNPVEGVQAQVIDFTNVDDVVEVIDEHDATIISVVARESEQANREIQAAHRALISAAPSGRFIFVGGAGSLLDENGNELRNAPDFPAIYKSEADLFGEIYAMYKEAPASLQWTMVSPAPVIAPGVRTGDIKLDLDRPAGNFISTQDFAIALVDEAVKPKHINKRFTAASVDEQAASGK
ncbi:NAD(P)-dependent oxidoreductase [Rothia terrae]|uniref:NAD(P)-dependent oxidoreductase n=1 Tax=Rothia terrae TaxID=396015 RepID=UPI0033CB9A8C